MVAGSLPSQTLPLQEVILVVAADSLPEKASQWHLCRVVLASEKSLTVTELRGKCYFSGEASAVRAAFDRFSDSQPLGLLVDDAAGLQGLQGLETAVLEEVESLKEGYTFKAWEDVVSRVCNHHVETVQHMILRRARRHPQKLALVYEERDESLLICFMVDHLAFFLSVAVFNSMKHTLHRELWGMKYVPVYL
eukprot:TRINITY_DN54430_c0_g1_i1.p1 TRINITY_DN54430_c0_g1~~TRINITY_DN54430_c0_g1_i1.p1  ORF type:complete len:193 (-),score=24.15 TRINITY_DN54430_c0_g1_i1:18-596(-)